MKKIILAALLILSSNAFAGSVSVEDAYVRLLPPTLPNTGAFMVFKNSGDTDIAAISVESDVAEVVEMHTHIHKDGIMKMRQVEKIDIPAHGETALQPGGFHIMLIGLKQPLELGQMVDMKVNFDDGSSEEIKAEVKNVMAGMQMKEGMDHDKMDPKKMDHEKMDHSKMDPKKMDHEKMKSTTD